MTSRRAACAVAKITDLPRARRGRPTKFTREAVETAKRCIALFMTDEQICAVLGVHPVTWYRWLQKHPNFRKAVTRAKHETDAVIEAALVRRAMGYSVEATKVFMTTERTVTTDAKGRQVVKERKVPVHVPYLEHIPADVGAITLYLKNRAPERWNNPDVPGPPPAAPEVVALRQRAMRGLLRLVEDNARRGGRPLFDEEGEPTGEPVMIEEHHRKATNGSGGNDGAR
jgi:hypothetical protein